MEILKRAKAVDNATVQKNGETRATPKRKSVNREYFDEPEVEYLTEAPVHTTPSPHNGGGSSLYDQMGVSSGGGSTTQSVDRMNVDSPMYSDSVENSNLPPAIKAAMMTNPIPQPSGVTSVTPEFLAEINPLMKQIVEETKPSYDEIDEGDHYSHPVTQTRVEQPRQQITETTKISSSGVRKMIAEEIAKALPSIIEQYFDKRVLKENISFKAGSTTFSGTVTPLPKKRIKRKQI